MRNSTVIGRVAATAAVAVALIAVVVIVLSSGSNYQVKAIFQDASQIVSGDQVQVGGNPVGTVSNISLTANGEAQLTLSISDQLYDPLRQGTEATVRQSSLSGIANRYVDLRLGGANSPTIPDNGVIGTQNTTSAVDLDQLFNTLDAPTRKGLQNLFQGSASQYAGQGQIAQRAWQYLNPAIASSSVLFSELDRNTPAFTNYIVKTDHLVTDLAQRSSDLSGLISHLSTTTQALAAQRVPLAQSLQQLPGFMRLANTTFVNLRNALNDLKPLVDDTKPVAPKLQKLLAQLRPLAQDAVPTVNDLSKIISRPGANNDLIELVKLGVPLANVTVRSIQAGGKLRPGAFNQSTIALDDSTPELATARPYAVDLTGWFEGYTHPGTIDANGSASRISPTIGIGTLQNGALTLLGALLTGPGTALRGVYAFGTTLLGPITGGVLGGGSVPAGIVSPNGLVTSKQGDRCPGSMERGAVYVPQSGFPCNPKQIPTGP